MTNKGRRAMLKINRKKVLKIITLFSILLVTGIIAYYGVHKYYYKQREHKVFGLAAYYSSSEELVKNSDNIIIGKVESVEEPFTTNIKDYIVTPSKIDKSKLPDIKDEHICSKVRVIKSIKGNLEPEEVIPILQSGVAAGGNNLTIPQSRILKVNEQYILFLRYTVPTTEQQKKDYKIPLYVVLNPFQGQININNNKLDIDIYELPMFKGIDNINELQRMINDAMKALNNK